MGEVTWCKERLLRLRRRCVKWGEVVWCEERLRDSRRVAWREEMLCIVWSWDTSFLDSWTPIVLWRCLTMSLPRQIWIVLARNKENCFEEWCFEECCLQCLDRSELYLLRINKIVSKSDVASGGVLLSPHHYLSERHSLWSLNTNLHNTWCMIWNICIFFVCAFMSK